VPDRRALWLLGAGSLAFVGGVVEPSFTVLGVVWDVLVVVLMVWDGRRARSVGVTGQRALPDRVHQQDTAELALTLQVDHTGPLTVWVRDPLHGHVSEQPVEHHASTVVAPGHTWTHTVQPTRRGVVQLGAAVVRVRGPLGLAWHQSTVRGTEADTLHVLPQRHLDGEDGRYLHRHLAGRPGTHARRRTGTASEVAHLREYHPGDSRRAIHWRASARRHRPITRVSREAHQRHVVLLLDAGRTMAAATDHRSRFDRMLAAVLAFARVVVHRRDRATVVVYDTVLRHVVHLDPRDRAFRIAYDTLCDVEPTHGDSDPGVAAAWVRANTRRGMRVVFCTALTDPTNTERLVAAAGTTARRHPTVLLQLVDAELERAARLHPDTVHEAYVKASAMARRRRLVDFARSLEAVRVPVVRAPADRLVVSLAARMDGR